MKVQSPKIRKRETRVFVTEYDRERFLPKSLFSLARPFLKSSRLTEQFNLLGVHRVEEMSNADLVIISEPLGERKDLVAYKKLEQINKFCGDVGIKAFAMVAGDFGKVHPTFNNIVYFRLGGFRSQLDESNRALFPVFRDPIVDVFDGESITAREWTSTPVVGFCGHATNSKVKYLYERSKLFRENLRRLVENDWTFEPMFSSAFERFRILAALKGSNEVRTNFLLREHYRAGATDEEARRRTAREYFENIRTSDYVLCLRGAGNFSVRFFETLAMGRIPVLVDTDCMLPLEDEIEWNRHAVIVPWSQRNDIVNQVARFHKKLTKNGFLDIQLRNRQCWATKLTPLYFLMKIAREG